MIAPAQHWTPALKWWPNGFDLSRENRITAAVRVVGARLESGEWYRQASLVNAVQRGSGLGRHSVKNLLRELIRAGELERRGECRGHCDTRQVRRPGVWP